MAPVRAVSEQLRPVLPMAQPQSGRSTTDITGARPSRIAALTRPEGVPQEEVRRWQKNAHERVAKLKRTLRGRKLVHRHKSGFFDEDEEPGLERHRLFEFEVDCSNPFGTSRQDPLREPLASFEEAPQELASDEVASRQRIDSRVLDELPPGTSQWQVGTNVANMIMGGALFTVPHFMCDSGWFGLLVILSGTGLMLFSGILLGYTLRAVEEQDEGTIDPTYGDIGKLLLGSCGSPLLEISLVAESFITAVFFLVFVSRSLTHLVGLPVDTLIHVAAFCSAVVVLVPPEKITVLNRLGVVFTVASVVIVMVSGLELGSDRWDSSSQILVGQGGGFFTDTAVFVPIVICAGDHCAYPGIYTSTRSLTTYNRGLSIAYISFAVVVCLLCTVTYLTFGENLREISLHNIDETMPPWVANACLTALAVRTFMIVPEFLKGVHKPIVMLFGCLGLDFKMKKDENELGVFRRSAGCFLGRIFVWLLCFHAAATVAVRMSGFLDELEALITALFKSMNVFVIPCFGFCKLCTRRSKLLRALSFLLGLCSLVFGGLGTYHSIKKITAINATDVV